MNYKEYEKAFSAARLAKYQTACKGNANDALTLYRYNIKLCQKFYGILNVFEVVLRNAIDEHYKAVFNDDDWICAQLQKGGSDVDVCYEGIPKGFFAVCGLKRDLEELFGCSVDVVRLREKMDTFFKERILKEVIYV